MTKILHLTYVLFKNGLSTFGTGKSNSTKNSIYLVILAFAFFPLIKDIVSYTSETYSLLHQFNQEKLIIAISSMMVTLLIMVFGVFYILNIFFFSNDIAQLLPLPLKPSEILISKSIIVLLYEYLTELIFVVPVFITYGVMQNAGIVYYFYAFIVFLFLPFLPLTISGIIALFLMSFSSIAKNKDRFRIVSGAILFIGIFSLNFYIKDAFNIKASPDKMLLILKSGPDGLLNYYTNFIPSIKFSTYAMTNYADLSSILNLLIFIIIGIISFLVFLFFGKRFYFKGVSGIYETSTAKSKDFKLSVSNSKNPVYEIFFTEIRILFRTPAFFLNCILINVIWPFMVIFYLNSITPILLSRITNYFLSQDIFIFAIFGIGIGLVASAINGLAASAISRDGNSHSVYRYLPISFIQFVTGKILPVIAIGFIGVLFIIIPALYFFPVLIPYSIIILLFAIPGIAFSSVTGILLDLLFPKLIWENEYKPVKQNLNVVFNMLINVLLLIALILLIVKLHFNTNIYLMLIISSFIILLWLVFRLLLTFGRKLYNNIC